MNIWSALNIIAIVKNTITRIKRRNEENKIVIAFNGYMKDNWNFAKKTIQTPRIVERHWSPGPFEIVHTRQLRGDLIQVYLSRFTPMGVVYTECAAWVDQSHAYSGLLDLNDIKIDPELRLEFVREMLAHKEPQSSPVNTQVENTEEHF